MDSPAGPLHLVPDLGWWWQEDVLSLLDDDELAHLSSDGFSAPPPSPRVDKKARPNNFEDVEINEDRVWADIMETASFGAIAGTTGMNRLALSPSDQSVRQWFIDRAHDIGCRVWVDEIGNIFAMLPGEDNSLPPIGIGSHLDTQPQGGRFDGILGVLGAIEVLRCVKENNVRTHRPLVAINWTNEEGAQFESGCTGSAVWAGHIPLEQAYSMKTIDGKSTLYQELCQIGFRGTCEAHHALNSLSAHFELHIEQGPHLERAGKQIGVVNGVSGNRRLSVRVQGEVAHAGSTPMSHRTDPLVASSKIVLLVEEAAVQHSGFGTVGMIQCPQGSINCVPGETCFTVDLRHHCGASLDLMEQTILSRINQLQCEQPKLGFYVEKLWESPVAEFDETAIGCVREAARRRVGCDTVAEMISFAGHDSAMTNLRVLTGMIFVPSREGISHAPEEFTSKAHCALGVQVLMDAVLSYDRLSAEY